MKTTVIPIPSDEHINSPVGLAPEGQWQLDAGGYYTPSHTQRIIRKQFDECVSDVAYVRKRSDLVVVNNGDAVEMNKHSHSMRITQNGDEAVRMASVVFDDMLRGMKFGKKHDKLFFIRGTESHVGELAKYEERLARDLDARPEYKGSADNDYKDGRYTHYVLRLVAQGQLIQIAHHGPAPGRREWTRENALWYELKNTYFNCLKTGQPIPRVMVWSHYHTFVETAFKYPGGQIDGFLTPGLTTKDGFAHKSTRGTGLAHVGMLAIIVAEDGTVERICPRIEYQDTPAIEV